MQGGDIYNQVSSDLQKGMQQRARETGSQPVQHVADVLKTQHDMVVDKQLVERSKRIAKYLDDIRRQSPQDFELTKRQIDSLRPLLRLSLRSVEFRQTSLGLLRVLKHIFEDNVEGSVEGVLENAEKGGWQPAKQEVKRIKERTLEQGRQKQKIISDEDWVKLRDQLNRIFSDLHQHPEYQNAMRTLFDLPQSLVSSVNKPTSRSVENLKEESKGLIAQFSGREILDNLFEKIRDLIDHFENNQEAQRWWKDFRDLVEHIAKDYTTKEDFDRMRAHLNKGYDIFDDYRPQINEILDMISDIFDKMSNDEYVKDLQERLSIVADDLYWVDSDGERHLNVEATEDISTAVGDLIRRELRNMHLIDVDGMSEDGIHYHLSNLNICADLPDKVRLHMESDAVLDTSVDVHKDRRFRSEIVLTASVRGVRMEGKGIKFLYESSSLTECGLMDVVIPSANLCVDFLYSPHEPSDKSGFVKEVGGRSWFQFLRVRTHFSVSDLQITFDKSSLKHPVLVPILTTLFKPYLIGRFESGIQDSMNESLRDVGERISSIMQQSPFDLGVNTWPGFLSGFETEGKLIE
jgi:hypothetical protein